MSLQLPASSEIQFNDAEIRKAARGPRLPDGWHLFTITEVEAVVSEKEKSYGNIMLVAKCAALRDPDDVNSKVRPLMYQRVTLPFANPNVDGHEVPSWAPSLASQFFRAVDEDLPLPPRRGQDGYEFRGEVIDPATIEDCKAEALEAVYEAAKAAMADPTTLVGRAFYGNVYEKKGFHGINEVKAELPDDAELADLSTYK